MSPESASGYENGVPVANAAVAVNKPVELLYAVVGTTDNFAYNLVVAQFYSHFYGPNNPDPAAIKVHATMRAERKLLYWANSDGTI